VWQPPRMPYHVRQTRHFAVSERGQCVESNVVVASDGSPGAVACRTHNHYGRPEGSLIYVDEGSRDT
jgi:hypothetical protein